jgi:hypothetical protein
MKGEIRSAMFVVGLLTVWGYIVLSFAQTIFK